MVKRSRDEAAAALRTPPSPPMQQQPELPPPPKRYRESVGGGVGVAGKARGGVAGEKGGRVEAVPAEEEAKRIATADSVPPVAECETHGGLEVAAAAAEWPGWWWWWAAGGGMMVDYYEELLCGWFPFVEEDFCYRAGEMVGWYSSSPSGELSSSSEAEERDSLYDVVADIWQLKHVNEIPSRTR